MWKVTWAHPEFGQVIATCSFDRTAAVWEEVGKKSIGLLHIAVVGLNMARGICLCGDHKHLYLNHKSPNVPNVVGYLP